MNSDTITVKDRIESRTAVLESYEEKLGLPKSIPPGTEEELQSYLNMPRDHIEALSIKQAVGICGRLSQYSYYIQQQVNRNKAILSFINHLLHKMCVKQLDQYKEVYKYELKIYKVASGDKAGQEMLECKQFAEERIARLNELANGINKLSYSYSMIRDIKD